HLGDDVTRGFRGGQLAAHDHGDGNRRIEVGAADGGGTEGADKNGQSPAGGDDDPPPIVSFGLGEDYVGNDSVAEDDEEGCTDEFCEEGIHGELVMRLGWWAFY